MLKLKELSDGISYRILAGSDDTEITGITAESDKADAGTVFVCIKGSIHDGHDYIADAIENGACAVVVEETYEVITDGQLKEAGVTVISTESTEKALSVMAANYYGRPAERLITIGITGTKGKTTTSFMIKRIFDAAGIKTGLIGTIGILKDEVFEECDNTTPDGLTINRALKDMADAGCRAVVIEVSSQALKHHRTDGIIFDYGIFTNLTSDHIGEFEHRDFEEYRECKKRLFEISEKGIINIDDRASLYIMKNKNCEYITYGYREEADLRCIESSFRFADSHPVTEFKLTGMADINARLFLPGKFNIYNAMAAIAVSLSLGIDKKFFSAIENIVIPGRAQSIISDDRIQVIVDYAHNEASLESILKACAEHNPKRLVCVFGCGGNRSKDRRIGMGRVSGMYADFTIITEDNSRNEALEDILTDIKTGLAMTDGFYVEIPDRRTAIRFSILNSKPGDFVVIAGKGHEEYQETDGKRVHFSDAEEALKAYEEFK